MGEVWRDVVPAEIPCAALQPVLDGVSPVCRGSRRRLSKGASIRRAACFLRDGIEMFAGYISAGERPELTSNGRVTIEHDLVCDGGGAPSHAAR